jgi:Cu/Ag efflux protein CusF
MTSLRVSLAAFLLGMAAIAQTPPNRSQVSGTIAGVDAAGSKVTLKSDKGDEVTVSTTARTLLLKMPPGETDPKKGAKITLADINAGDRAVVVAPQGSDPKSLAASAILVMSKSDVASLQQKDVDDWRKRGTTGNVTAIDAAAKTVTIKAGSRTFTVKPSEKTTYFRYAPDSARFADAKPAAFGDIKTGDQMRVLGNKSEDGATILAEKIVSGSFRQIAATISAIDPAEGQLTVKDLASKATLTIKVVADSTMKKLPDTMAAMLARRYAPGAQQGGGAPGAGGGGGRGPGGGRGGDVSQMLDNLPPLPLSELKKGDAIMVSTTQGADATHATVIMLLAGVEPLLTASPTATRDIMSGWNLGGGGGEGQ